MTAPQEILVVDDTAQNRFVAEGHLTAAGFAVVQAASGPEALARFAERPPDLVLLDILMPGMDGFETCRRLRALPGGADTPIVFLTALADLDTHARALDAGADDFLTKPIHRIELLLRVRSLVRIKRLTNELRAERDALVRVEAKRKQLTELVVHDLKNPLSVTLVNCRLIGKDPTLSERSRRCVNDALSCAEHMHGMVLNLLDISRSEDAALVARATRVSLGPFIDEACTIARSRAAERRHHLRASCTPADLAAIADHDLLRRVLDNLIDNSLKYTPAGGGVEVEALPAGADDVDIRVSDEGPGIPPAMREKIFDKYVQLDADADVGRASHGLGLLFCRLAVEAQGGRIWVEDNASAGSVFCVRLRAWRPAT